MKYPYQLALLMGLLLLHLQESTGSESNSNPSFLPDITTFAFRGESNAEINPLSLPDPPEEDEQQQQDQTVDESSETSSQNPAAAAAAAGESSSSSVFSSPLLYEGGCVVSAEAIMCAGGCEGLSADNNNSNGGFVGGIMNFNFDDEEEDEDESDDDDDDDDDDNDGHSSMLSNASLRRSKVGAGGFYRHQPPPPSPSNNNNNKQGQEKGDTATQARPGSKYNSYLLQQSSSFCFSTVPFVSTGMMNTKALSLRGGAGGATAAAEVSINANNNNNLGSEFAKKLLVTALVTLVYEFMIGHTLEFVKICMQTSPDGTSYGTVIKDITAEKGIGGLWDGFCPWGVIQSVFKGSVFGLAHAVASSALIPLTDAGKIPSQVAKTVAGGIAGGFQGFVLSPTLLLKTRVMTNPVFREKMSLARTTWLSAKIGCDVVATEGIGALMKGAGVFSTKRVCDWASRYYFSDRFESFALKKKGSSLNTMEKISCSLLGGTVSTFVTLPLDVLVAKIQDAKKAGVSVSAWKMFQGELSEKGWRGLKNSYMKGFEVRLLHVALTTVAIRSCTPIAYDLLFGKKKRAA